MPSTFPFHDPRLDLIPAEHLAADGIDEDWTDALRARGGWSDGHIATLEAAIELYWDRYDDLAEKAGYLSPPRLRSIGVIRDPESVRPYAQILNESTSTLYLQDLHPELSHPEFVAYLLAFGERAAETGEMLKVAVHLAPWWFDRSEEECAAFANAAQSATRPDARLYRAIANALPWLRRLRHRRLRPARKSSGYREIPGTGLLVPRANEGDPDELIGQIQRSATDTLRSFHSKHGSSTGGPHDEFLEWLADAKPAVLITDARERVLWDPEKAAACGTLHARIASCGDEVVTSIREDLQCIDERSRRFLASVRDVASLPLPDGDAAQSGYSFLHRTRRIIGYNLDEPGIERREVPAIPYARAMLGARTLHEWGHLAVDAGWVPRDVDGALWDELRQALAAQLDELIRSLPKATATAVKQDIADLSVSTSAGEALVDIFERRLPDYQANLLAARYQNEAEREAYVRQNIRPVRREYDASRVLRMLVRYLYEMQYLGFSRVEDPRAYFFETTWFESDFFDTGILDEERLDLLATAAHRLCDAHRIETERFVGLPDLG